MSIAERSTPPLVDGETLTRDEFMRRWEAMPQLKRAELLGGVVYLPSPLSIPHGEILAAITGWLCVYRASTTGCRAAANATWFMRQDVPQPDGAMWLAPECGGKSVPAGLYQEGPPEFVAEVSLSSKERDLGPKFQLYQDAGVKEYLTVLIHDQEVRWHRLVPRKYRLMPPGDDGVLRSVVFPGLWLNPAALFADDAAGVLATLQEGLASKEHAEFVKRLARKKRPKGKK
jgi:Uma2 family endonuclease